MNRRRCCLIAFAVLLAEAGLPCAGVWHPGEDVLVASEQALIVWDPNTQTETFIRSADFEGKGSDFRLYRSNSR